MVSSFGPQIAGRRLVEDHRLLGERHAGLGGVVGIVEPDGDEIADPADARPDARIAAHQRQLVDLRLADLGEPLGRERLAGDVGHDLRQVADAALRIEDAGLFAAGRAVADELHRSSPWSGCEAAKVGAAIMRRRRSDGQALQRAIRTSRKGAAVDQQVLTGDVAGVRRAQERAGRAELVRLADALAPARSPMRSAPPARRLMPRFLAVASKFERSRSVSNAPGSRKLMVTLRGGDRAGDAGQEAGQAGARARGQVEPGERHLHRARGDVDDAAEFLAPPSGRSPSAISSIATTMLAIDAVDHLLRGRARGNRGTAGRHCC